MALVAKSVTASPSQGIAPQRGPSSGARSSVATFNAAVDAANPVAGASIDTTSYSANVDVDQDGANASGSRYSPSYQDHRDAPTPRTGVIDTPSQSFVAMLELRDTFDASSVVGEGAAKKFIGRLVGKAVEIYDQNVQATVQDQPARGDTVSLTL